MNEKTNKVHDREIISIENGTINQKQCHLNYRKVESSNTSRFEAYAGFFRLLVKEIFDLYVL